MLHHAVADGGAPPRILNPESRQKLVVTISYWQVRLQVGPHVLALYVMSGCRC
jgi:hypothetical protein